MTTAAPGFDPEIYQQLLTTTGTYTVALQAVSPGTGKVTLTLKHTPPPSLDEGPQTHQLQQFAERARGHLHGESREKLCG